ncbi:hypothetical protein BV923_10575 [Pectobacterium odoriferum]|nr:hypothetical protein BV923_10575 [Pectobacterium odoriferum]
MRSSFTVFLIAPRTRPTKGGSIAVALGTLACGAKLYRYVMPSSKAAAASGTRQRRSEQESIDDEGTAKRHHFPPNSLGSQGGGD